MTATIQSFGIDRLSLADRVRLLDELSESVAQEMAAAPLTERQREEVDRRLAAHAAAPSRAIPAEQVHAGIRARMKQ